MSQPQGALTITASCAALCKGAAIAASMCGDSCIHAWRREPEETKEPGEEDDFAEQAQPAALPAPGMRGHHIMHSIAIFVEHAPVVDDAPLQLAERCVMRKVLRNSTTTTPAGAC